MAWELGYGGPALCEYYLRTGDKDILPKIHEWADNAVKGQYLDAWAGRGGVPAVTYGMGHLNAARIQAQIYEEIKDLSTAERIAYFQRGNEEFRREKAQREALAGELVLREEPSAYDDKKP